MVSVNQLSIHVFHLCTTDGCNCQKFCSELLQTVRLKGSSFLENWKGHCNYWKIRSNTWIRLHTEQCNLKCRLAKNDLTEAPIDTQTLDLSLLRIWDFSEAMYCIMTSNLRQVTSAWTVDTLCPITSMLWCKNFSPFKMTSYTYKRQSECIINRYILKN